MNATDAQITALRNESLKADDYAQAAICCRALGESIDIPADYISADDMARAEAMSVAEAADLCTEVIESASAMDDGCTHESVTPANGHGVYCEHCGETLA